MALQGNVFRGSTAISLGLVTKAELRSPAWIRLARDVYADAALTDEYFVRSKAAGLLLPPGVAVSGRSAAKLAGLDLDERDEPVLALAPAGSRPQRRTGFRIRRVAMPDSHVQPARPLIGGSLTLTTAERTAWELGSNRSRPDAVADLDAAVRADFVDLATLRRWAGARPCSRAASAISLVDPRAESRPESRLRVRLRHALEQAPEIQYEVWWRGAFIARLDFAWPRYRIAVEYEGEHHGRAGQLAKDRARLNALTEAGWNVLFATKADLADPDRFGRLVGRIAQALASAR